MTVCSRRRRNRRSRRRTWHRRRPGSAGPSAACPTSTSGVRNPSSRMSPQMLVVFSSASLGNNSSQQNLHSFVFLISYFTLRESVRKICLKLIHNSASNVMRFLIMPVHESSQVDNISNASHYQELSRQDFKTFFDAHFRFNMFRNSYHEANVPSQAVKLTT